MREVEGEEGEAPEERFLRAEGGGGGAEGSEGAKEDPEALAMSVWKTRMGEPTFEFPPPPFSPRITWILLFFFLRFAAGSSRCSRDGQRAIDGILDYCSTSESTTFVGETGY